MFLGNCNSALSGIETVQAKPNNHLTGVLEGILVSNKRLDFMSSRVHLQWLCWVVKSPMCLLHILCLENIQWFIVKHILFCRRMSFHHHSTDESHHQTGHNIWHTVHFNYMSYFLFIYFLFFISIVDIQYYISFRCTT